MSAPDFSLLTTRRFGPMFVVQFLGAFNDNLLKFAMLFLANFGIFAAQPGKAEQLAAIATGLFILPYFLFSALAGQIADMVDKARLVRWIKLAEVAIMALALGGLLVPVDPGAADLPVPDGAAFHAVRSGQIFDPAAASAGT